MNGSGQALGTPRANRPDRTPDEAIREFRDRAVALLAGKARMARTEEMAQAFQEAKWAVWGLK